MADSKVNRGTGLLGCLLLACLLLTGCTPQRASTTPSLEEKIGQMLMVGFRGLAVNESPFVIHDIRQHHLGGVVLFDYDVLQQRAVRNIVSPVQVEALVTDLQAAARTPLLVAIDQEGGKIARLKAAYGFPATVSHRTLGRLDDLANTAQHSRACLKILTIPDISEKPSIRRLKAFGVLQVVGHKTA